MQLNTWVGSGMAACEVARPAKASQTTQQVQQNAVAAV